MTDAYRLAEQRIRAAIRDVTTRGGLTVRPGETGVYRNINGTWDLDGGREVSPIGAVLIDEHTESDAPWVAASDLLGVSNVWCAGVDDGCSAEDERGRWRMLELYCAGWEFGATLRRELLGATKREARG